MNEPRRLSRSGGVSQRLLDSASIDKPSEAARRRAAALAATASSFASTQSGAATTASRSRSSTTKTLATWILIGAAASATLALLGSKLLGSGSEHDAANRPAPGMSVLAEPAAAPSVTPAHATDIASEPASPTHDAPAPAPAPSHSVKPGTLGSAAVPWVPSPVAAASGLAPTNPAAQRSAASFDEAREIEAARVAVSHGDDSGALATLNDYDQTHPNGELKPESMALRIQALSNSGKSVEARTLANDFQSKYPQHPLVQRVLRNVPK